MSEDVRIIHGDCAEVMKTIDQNSIDAIVTDPPFGMNWNTQCGRFSGGSRHHRKAAAGRDWDDPVTGDDLPFDPTPFLEFPKVILWGSNHFSSRLPVGTTLVWVKRNEDAFGSFLSDAEVGWMKGGHGVYLHKDLSMNAIAAARVHPNQKPVGLLIWAMERAGIPQGATVLDPFAGSGSTLVACAATGRRCIGIEIEARYIPVIESRVREASLPLLDAFGASAVSGVHRRRDHQKQPMTTPLMDWQPGK